MANHENSNVELRNSINGGNDFIYGKAKSLIDGISKILEDVFIADNGSHLNSIEKQKRNTAQFEILCEEIYIFESLLNIRIIQYREELKERDEENEAANIKAEIERNELIERSYKDLLLAKDKLEKLIEYLKEITELFDKLFEAKEKLKNSLLFCLNNLLTTQDQVIKVPGLDIEINQNNLVKHLIKSMAGKISNDNFDLKNMDKEIESEVAKYMEMNHGDLDKSNKNKVHKFIVGSLIERMRNNDNYKQVLMAQKEIVNVQTKIMSVMGEVQSFAQNLPSIKSLYLGLKDIPLSSSVKKEMPVIHEKRSNSQSSASIINKLVVNQVQVQNLENKLDNNNIRNAPKESPNQKPAQNQNLNIANSEAKQPIQNKENKNQFYQSVNDRLARREKRNKEKDELNIPDIPRPKS